MSGGLNVVRSTCPAVAVPAYTGDVSLFSPSLTWNSVRQIRAMTRMKIVLKGIEVHE